MSYRVRLTNAPEVSANGVVRFDTFTEVSTVDPDTGDTSWALIPGGHQTISVDGADIVAIVNGAGTNNQKLAAISALIKAAVKVHGLAPSDLANRALLSIYPGGTWPVGGFALTLEV